jgi:hypothetical protein
VIIWRRAFCVLTMGFALAGCQPLPQPFIHEITPETALPVAKDFFGVRIEPTSGLSNAMETTLDTAMTAAFEEADIPAAIQSGNQRSLILRGTARLVQAGGVTMLSVDWRISDPHGQEIGVTRQETALPGGILTAPHALTFARLAVAPLTRYAADPAPVVKPDAGIAIGSIDGAPGDGKTSLAQAIGAVMRQHNVPISESSQSNSLVLLASVDIDKPNQGKQNVSIRWVLMQPDGGEVGSVEQHNQIKAGSLDGIWGETAFAIAGAAFDGIMQLVETAKAKGTD